MKKVGAWGLFYVGLVGVVAYGVMSLQQFYATPSHVYILSHHSKMSALSDDCKKRLHAFFKYQGSVQQPSIIFAETLKKEFPAVKKITFAYKNQKKTEVMLECAQPLFVFNNKVAITQEGLQVTQNDFSFEQLNALPHFCVTQRTEMPLFSRESIQYAQQLDPVVHELYNVTWVDGSRVEFHDKKYPQITVFGSVETKAEDVLLPACRTLVAELVERKPNRKRDKSDWCIDRRFKGQMIVFPGGKDHV